jgi:hypothetical protein
MVQDLEFLICACYSEGIRFSPLCAACFGLPLLSRRPREPYNPTPGCLAPSSLSLSLSQQPVPVLPFGRIKPPCTCTHAHPLDSSLADMRTPALSNCIVMVSILMIESGMKDLETHTHARTHLHCIALPLHICRVGSLFYDRVVLFSPLFPAGRRIPPDR